MIFGIAICLAIHLVSYLRGITNAEDTPMGYTSASHEDVLFGSYLSNSVQFPEAALRTNLEVITVTVDDPNVFIVANSVKTLTE